MMPRTLLFAFLAVALLSSIATFYLWPLYEEHIAERYVSVMKQSCGCGENKNTIDYESFEKALAGDSRLARRI